MKTIDLSRQGLSGDELTALADEAAVLIVSRTGRRFVLEEADSFVQEVATLRRSTKFMNFLAKRSKEAGAVTLEEFERRLTSRRKKR